MTVLDLLAWWNLIIQSVDMHRDLNAMFSGVPVDFAAITAKYEGVDTLALSKMWSEVKERCDPLRRGTA